MLMAIFIFSDNLLQDNNVIIQNSVDNFEIARKMLNFGLGAFST